MTTPYARTSFHLQASDADRQGFVVTSRPSVKRQYGSRKAISTPAASALGSSPSRSLRTAAPPSPTPPSSSPSRLRPHRRAIASSDWAGAIAESFPEEYETMISRSGKTEQEQETLSAGSAARDEAKDVKEPGGRVLRERKSPSKPTAGKGDLRSFFQRASPRKRRRLSSPADDHEAASSPAMARSLSSSSSASSSASSTLSTTTTLSSSSSSSSKPSKHGKAPAKLEQLYLDPYENAGHATLSCTVCALSYARTPEDIAFHSKHHKKVVSGCDWTSTDDGKGVSVLDDAVEWAGKEGGKIVMVDYPLADAATKRKLKDIFETIDTELSSTSLTPAQLADSKIFLFVTPQRKVIAAAVVQRLEAAYEVVTSAEKSKDEEKPSADLLRFGEEQGAIFCSPTPLPTLLGIQRIWTSTSSRRSGLASLILNHVAARYVYGSPIPLERRAIDFAFSQPTGKGQKLARAWTRSERFKVFID
ncbi:hypothetical protein JCM11641_001568 [Rhodosporidiobolus odoratus]